MTNAGTRTFGPEDQVRFARLSGDWNPMHVDPIAARRTMFGGQVVHGIHILLWALDCVAARICEPRGLSRLTCRFARGVRLGLELQVSVDAEADGKWQMSVGDASGSFVRASAEFSAHSGPDAESRCGEFLQQAPDCLSFKQAAGATGRVECALDPILAREWFPNAFGILPERQLAAILATTRIVGMRCPGLHSIFSGLDLCFTPDANDVPALEFTVERSDARFSSLALRVGGAGVSGVLQTFFRPPPQPQPSWDECRSALSAGEFAEMRAVVIGGSRGLGEVAVKLLAEGGAQVCFTYSAGKEDADRLADAAPAELRSQISTRRFDVLQPHGLELPWRPTHVFYFATPFISVEKGAPFSAEKFRRFCEFYVSGFHDSLRVLSGDWAESLHAFYPSTIFLEQAAPSMAEYCMAKAAGEELCRQLMLSRPGLKIHAPRLPKMATDQTAGIIPAKLDSPVAVLRDEFRNMRQERQG